MSNGVTDSTDHWTNHPHERKAGGFIPFTADILPDMSPDRPHYDTFTLIIIAGIAVASVIAFWPLASVIILALTLAVVALPLQRRLSSFIRPGASAILITILVLVILIAAIAITVVITYQNADLISDIISGILGWIQGSPQDPDTYGIRQTINSQFTTIGTTLTGIIGQIPFFSIQFLIFLLTFYLAILKGDAFHGDLLRIIPEHLRHSYTVIQERSVNTLYAVWIVHFFTALVTFLLAVPFFYLIGSDRVLFFSFIAAVFQLIPIIGPSMLMLVLGIYALSTGDYRTAVLLAAIGYPVVCAFPDLYLRPLLMGRRASIHPVLMWIGFFGGILVMGIIGFVLGPLIIALIVAGYSILKEQSKDGNAQKGPSIQ
jgi:predicted PurR-regulated permease PerM